MSKNFDQLPQAGDLAGTETLAVNQGGVTKFTTINKIKDFLIGVYETVGAAAAAVAEHLGAFDHNQIDHANRAALDSVAGVNTGDQDISGFALSNNSTFSGTLFEVGLLNATNGSDVTASFVTTSGHGPAIKTVSLVMGGTAGSVTLACSGPLSINSAAGRVTLALPIFASNAAALAAGLTVGMLYVNTTVANNPVCSVQ